MQLFSAIVDAARRGPTEQHARVLGVHTFGIIVLAQRKSEPAFPGMPIQAAALGKHAGVLLPPQYDTPAGLR